MSPDISAADASVNSAGSPASGPMGRIESRLQSGQCVVIDGATGTELERRGAKMHDQVWCATATETSPEILADVHEDYIRAGAQVIITNTFSTNRNMLDPAGLGDRFDSLNRSAVRIAKLARERAQAEEEVVVAGSMSHQVPIQKGTAQRDKERVPDAKIAAGRFREMAETLADAGVDLLLLEMMSDPDFINPAIEAARSTGLPLWVGFSARPGQAGRGGFEEGSESEGEPALFSYSRPDISFERMLDDISLDGVQAAGIMHTKTHVVTPALACLGRRFSKIKMAYPDSGFFKMPNWQFVDVIPIDDFAQAGRRWASEGVQIIGGCCGLGIEHIEALAAALAEDREDRS
ncbi:homocysteine S-methyltransferase family protein [Thioalkalivibrio sp. HK1]|uniref:homocysteine S-methyltransferase family protein n=1 Tax=Thioalkalivibrio sp. HK1 TaxID=1469245 RepID=UPI00046EB6F2|nr:homocysteine S-methyltransferase family protein [Thioalkalivibrio sp. HK1]